MSTETTLPQTKKQYLQISATQLETFAGSRESCNRKWYFGSVRKLKTLQNDQARFGTAFHEILERHFNGYDHGDPTTGVPVELFPPGWDDGLTPQEADLCRRLISIGQEEGLLAREPGNEVESKFFFRLINEENLVVDVIGYRDLINRDKWLVQDHKTTGSGYAKTEYTLPRTAQMQLYALSLIVEFLARGGKPNELPDEVFVQHNIFCASTSNKERREGKKPRAWRVGPVPIKVRAPEAVDTPTIWTSPDAKQAYCGGCRGNYPNLVETSLGSGSVRCSHCGDTVAAEERALSLDEALDMFVARARQMAEVAKFDNWKAIPDPPNVQAACNAYNSICPYFRICGGMETENEYRARMKKILGESETPEPETPAEQQKEIPVSALARLRGAANGAPAPAPTPPPAPQAAAPIPSTPPPQPQAAPPPAPPSNLQTQMQGINRLSALLKQQTPQVNPNPVPPEAPVQPFNPAQPRMPWAIDGCRACGSVGVSEAGRPCMVCDDLTRQRGGQTSDQFVWRFENNLLSITNKDGSPVVVGTQNGQPQTFTQAPPNGPYPGPEGNSLKPAAPPPAQNVAASSEPAPAGELTVVASNDPLLATTTTVTTPPGETAQAPAKRKRRTKAEMQAARALAAPQSGQTTPEQQAAKEAAPDDEVGFTLCVGCRPTKGEIVAFDDVWSQNAAALAKAQNAKSFYDLKPFERADRLVANVSQIVDMLHGTTVYVPRDVAAEQRGLVSELRSLAAEVYEA